MDSGVAGQRHGGWRIEPDDLAGGGPTMFARIGIMRALNRHVERVFNPDRKGTQWGRRQGPLPTYASC